MTELSTEQRWADELRRNLRDRLHDEALCLARTVHLWKAGYISEACVDQGLRDFQRAAEKAGFDIEPGDLAEVSNG